jgi:hypothetical protein
MDTAYKAIKQTEGYAGRLPVTSHLWENAGNLHNRYIPKYRYPYNSTLKYRYMYVSTEIAIF